MAVVSKRIDFPGSHGASLSARLDMPDTKPRAYALFAHCFTCSKDLHVTRRIAQTLAGEGIAVLRFDFTGLGNSEGEFASTNFSSNVADLVEAANMLRRDYQAPSLLIGHSLGGAAVLVAASRIEETRAVATIGAPADAAHVVKNFKASEDEIRRDGSGEVEIEGRKFTIESQFLDDLEETSVREAVTGLRKPLMIMHSPLDQIVGIDNASRLFLEARHPKSFVSLDHADHLLSNEEDAEFAARTIAAWASRYLAKEELEETEAVRTGVHVGETGYGKFQNAVQAGPHRLLADEPEAYGGNGTGPSPYDFLSIALGACTAMTLRMYADRKDWDIGPISCDVDHEKVHAKDCADCPEELRSAGGKIDHFHRRITVEGTNDPEILEKLLEIADKCPVHRTLNSKSSVTTAISPA
ncbi:MAG: OsmC family protein [Nitratireductor sp.]|nr:OsmC family protein [Nitratireductor sp.]